MWFRLTLIPESSRKILECEWFEQGRIKYTEQQYLKAVEELKNARWLVAGGTTETLNFQGGYENFNLAASCGALMREIFGDVHVYDGSAEAFYEELEKMFNMLNEKQRAVIRLCYGFEDGNFYTFKEIGAKLRMSSSNASNYKMGAIRELSKQKDKLRHSKEFDAGKSILAEKYRIEIRAVGQNCRHKLRKYSIHVLNLPSDMKKLLDDGGCNTIGEFLSFNPNEGLSDEMIAAINQAKLDFCMEMLGAKR